MNASGFYKGVKSKDNVSNDYPSPLGEPVERPSSLGFEKQGFGSNQKQHSFDSNTSSNSNSSPNKSKMISNEEIKEKLQHIKKWATKSYMCSKQLVNEKLGKRSPTSVDSKLEEKISNLKETQTRYLEMLKNFESIKSQIENMAKMQKSVGDNLAQLSSWRDVLTLEYQTNAEVQLVVAKNGDDLLTGLNRFIDALSTFTNKTMEDTLITVAKYNEARLEYDSYHSDLSQKTLIQAQNPSAVNPAKITQLKTQSAEKKEILEKLSQDVNVKIQLLEDNRIQVMKKHLAFLHATFQQYFESNYEDLKPISEKYKEKSKEEKNKQGENLLSFLDD